MVAEATRLTQVIQPLTDPVADRAQLVDELRWNLSAHLRSLRLDALAANGHSPEATKEMIRGSHDAQRREFVARERPALVKSAPRLLTRFAEGREVRPERIEPELMEVKSGEESSLLFRLATGLWSVPVSRGYGRRIRFLVMDRSNDKLIGIIALGDPVFNLRVRDDWIGWGVRERERRLVSVMDAYVVGAVPPYSQLLGGKLLTSILGCREVVAHFEKKYKHDTGLISGEQKHPKLALITVTSALGRSSIYNRVRLPGLVELESVGKTVGYGHFQVPEEIFGKMRDLLLLDDHWYTNAHKYGDGPNWKLRVIREALGRIGMDGSVLKHGIAREVFGMPLARNWREYLKGQHRRCFNRRPPLAELSSAAIARWVLPRAERRPEYLDWTRADTMKLLEALLPDTGAAIPQITTEDWEWFGSCRV